MPIGMWKYLLLLVAVAAYCSGDDPSVRGIPTSRNFFNILVEVIRKDTKKKVAMGTLLSPTRVLTSAKALVMDPSNYEANLMIGKQRKKRSFIIKYIIWPMVKAAIRRKIRGVFSWVPFLGRSLNGNKLNDDITMLSITIPKPVSHSALTFVKLMIPPNKKSRSLPSEWRTAPLKIDEAPCKQATVLGSNQGFIVDLIEAKKCAEQFNIKLKDGQFCSLNDQNLFCEADQQGAPVMCGDYQVGILIPGRYCNGTKDKEPLKFSRIPYGIADAMRQQADEIKLSTDEPTDSEGIELKPFTNIFV